jgi:3-methylfumaryl-CoA hydratase
MATDDARLQEWVGKSETVQDWIAAERCHAMQATLDRMDPLLREGDPLPPLWHWLNFWTIVPRSGLGRDGHPALGGFLPPIGTARRMWAGSRVRFLRPLTIGDHASKVSTIASVTSKGGRTGRLVFVKVHQEITGSAGLAIIDEHDIVYREDAGKGTSGRAGTPASSGRPGTPASSGRPGTPAPTEPTYAEEVKADPTMLFRYSALTFNGHRIHYDRDYATQVEGYAGLVVHGPLLATLMVDLAVRSWPDRTIANFEFRGHRPVIDTDPFSVCCLQQNNSSVDLWISDAEGMLAMQGKADFKGGQ